MLQRGGIGGQDGVGGDERVEGEDLTARAIRRRELLNESVSLQYQRPQSRALHRDVRGWNGAGKRRGE